MVLCCNIRNNFYGSTTKNLRCRSVWVCLCPAHPENHVSQKQVEQWRIFHPILVTNLFGFIYMYMLIGFRIKRSKVVTAGNDPKTLWTPPKKGIPPNFGHRCIWFIDVLIRFLGSKGQRSRSQQATTRKLCEHHISKTNEGNFTQFW